jgi:hypothetical protein
MLEEPVYSTCFSDLSSVATKDSFGLAKMADYIRGLGVLNALAGLKPLARGSQL